MSNNFNIPLSSQSPKRIGFACAPIVLKKFDEIANFIGWSKNALLTASIMHLVRMIEDKTYHLIPDVIIQVRALQKYHRVDFSTKETTFEKPSKKQSLLKSTAFSVSPLVLKKIDKIAHSIGWSRNSFILAAMLHLIGLVEDEDSAFVPTVVILARAVIYGDKIPLTFSSSASDQDQEKIPSLQ